MEAQGRRIAAWTRAEPRSGSLQQSSRLCVVVVPWCEQCNVPLRTTALADWRVALSVPYSRGGPCVHSAPSFGRADSASNPCHTDHVNDHPFAAHPGNRGRDHHSCCGRLKTGRSRTRSHQTTRHHRPRAQAGRRIRLSHAWASRACTAILRANCRTRPILQHWLRSQMPPLLQVLRVSWWLMACRSSASSTPQTSSGWLEGSTRSCGRTCNALCEHLRRTVCGWSSSLTAVSMRQSSQSGSRDVQMT